jgi:uncharacterized protein (DUF1015 family)
MATIRPFQGLRFTPDAGPLAELVAPPYDVVTPEQREALAEKNKHNVVHVTLPKSEDGERSKFVKYTRSAATVEEWRRQGIVAPEDQPALYRYRQRFTVPGSGQTYERTTLVALIKVEPYENGVVLPHEQTFPKHKTDRLRLLEATRSHLECIYGLIEDMNEAVYKTLVDAPAELVGSVPTDHEGIEHDFERITDASSIATLIELLEPKKVWIADGHHRYETALAFKESNKAGDDDAESYMMMAFSSISDPGLVLLPTHRILKELPVEPDEFKTKLEEFFKVQDAPNDELLEKLKDHRSDKVAAFGVALKGGQGFFAYTDRKDELADKVQVEGSQDLKRLDVNILHGFIFSRLLGLTGTDFFGYSRNPDDALASVENDAVAAILMNPPTVDDMRQVALGGERMPQKSTFYYPKLLSGLVMWQLKDFEG